MVRKRILLIVGMVLMMTVAFAGGSVYAGGVYDTPTYVNVELIGTEQVKVSFSMPSYTGVQEFEICCVRMDEGQTPVTKYELNGTLVPNAVVSHTYPLKDFCPKSGVYQFLVTAKGPSGSSAEKASDDVTVNYPEDGGGGGGGSGDGNLTDITGPTIKFLSADTNYTPIGYADISVSFNHGTYTKDGSPWTAWESFVELYRNGNLVMSRTLKSQSYTTFNKVPVTYGKKDTFLVKTFSVIDGKKYPGKMNTIEIMSKSMQKNKVSATKISSKQVALRWNAIEGATGYRVYKGNKKLKELKSSKTKYVVKGKGAAKAKYKVLPVISSGGKKYTGKSNVVKAKANVYKSGNTAAVGRYALEAKFVTKSISLKGKTYTVSGWAKNYSAITKLKKFKKIQYIIYCDGKIVAKKTLKNRKMRLNANSSRKMTFKIKGKAGADLRNGLTSYSVKVVCDPGMLTPRW